MDNSAIYLQKALDAVECVFQSEYKNSLGIPMPEIKLLLADDKHYTTGEYYITIGNTWQIHLNFGKLPVSFAEFQEEVKVLTRHEIGHYMCCPFDTITYFRMLKCILSVYDKEFKHLDLQRINSICGDIANQAADIIVDSSLCGMGRGAGNATTELVASYLNRKCGCNYSMYHILDAIDLYMQFFKENYSWGYSTANFIAGLYCCHVNNIA